MFRGPVPFMLGKIVVGIPAVIFDHQPVSRHLRNDGCRRNRTGEAVTLDDRALGDGKPGERHGVEQHKVRPEWKRVQRPTHCQTGCLKNVQPIDLCLRGSTDPDAGRPTHNLAKESVAFFYSNPSSKVVVGAKNLFGDVNVINLDLQAV